MAGLAYPDYLHHNNPNYALVDESELRGSFRTISSKTDRNNIPIDKRSLGAVVTWIDTEIRYTKQYNGTDLLDVNWQNDDNWIDFGGGLSEDITKYFYDITNNKGRIDYSNIVNAPVISGSLGYNSVEILSVTSDVFEKGTSNTVIIKSNVIIDNGITISNAVLNKKVNNTTTTESIALVSGVNTLTTTVTDTTIISISFTATKSTLSTTINSNSYTINFVYPYFYGVSASQYTGSDVYINLTKDIAIKNYAKKYSYTTTDQYFYFAYPTEYGSLLSIIETSSNFNIVNDFTISTVVVSNSNWSHSYYLVRSTNKYTVSNKFIKYFLYESDVNVVSTLQIFQPITSGDGTKYLSDDGTYKTTSGGLSLPIVAPSLTSAAIRLSDTTTTYSNGLINLYTGTNDSTALVINSSNTSSTSINISSGGIGLNILNSGIKDSIQVVTTNSTAKVFNVLNYSDSTVNYYVLGNGSIFSNYLKTLATSSGGNYLGIDTSTGLFKTMTAPSSSSVFQIVGTYGLNVTSFNSGSADYSNFIGYQSGWNTTSSGNCNFIGTNSGYNAKYASYSNFIGTSSGGNATSASYSNFIGTYVGYNATNAAYSNLFGYNTGSSFSGNNIGNNNIIIGTNITLPNATANSMNLGGVLFGTGFYSTTSGNPSNTPISGGKIGIGIVSPSYTLDVNGITQATQFKLSALNTAPSSSTATGTLGEIRIVNGYIYVCVATNTWQRTALTTW